MPPGVSSRWTNLPHPSAHWSFVLPVAAPSTSSSAPAVGRSRIAHVNARRLAGRPISLTARPKQRQTPLRGKRRRRASCMAMSPAAVVQCCRLPGCWSTHGRAVMRVLLRAAACVFLRQFSAPASASAWSTGPWWFLRLCCRRAARVRSSCHVYSMAGADGRPRLSAGMHQVHVYRRVQQRDVVRTPTSSRPSD